MARINDNNIGAISGAVRDMVSEGTNRAMNSHSFPEAPRYRETDQIRPQSGPVKYILAAIGVVAAVVLLFVFLSKSGERRVSPASFRNGREFSSESDSSLADRFGEEIYLVETSPGLWSVTDADTSERKLIWNEAHQYYYNNSDSLYFWYDASPGANCWQCWYRFISGDYGNYGWLENRDGLWYVQTDAETWIQVPQKYDTSILWSIVSDPS